MFTNFVAELVKTAANVPNAFKLSDTKSEQLEKQIEEFSAKNNLTQSLFPEHTNLSITDTRQLVISKLQENIKIRRIMTIKQEENSNYQKILIFYLNFYLEINHNIVKKEGEKANFIFDI